MKIALTLILIINFASAAEADTIDYWHVYYNNKKIREFTYNTRNTISLKSSQVKNNDSIKVVFYRDTPCDDCQTNIYVTDINDVRVTVSKGIGTGKMLSFSIAEILLYKRRTGKTTYQVCYFDKENISQAEKPVIFTIQLE